MADETWGTQMSLALRAIRSMHRDASRLLVDLDRVLPEYRPVYGSHATMDLTYSVYNGIYMADGLLRHWKRPAEAATAVGVNVVFWDDKSNVDEPLFVAAKMLYAEDLPIAADKNKAWDPWYAFLNWTAGREYEVLREAAIPSKRGDLVRVVAVGAPLRTISSEARAADLLKCARDYTFE